jgi:hypothetical protein
MLKITKSSEPIEVKTITVCLYGVPGIGKTSTAFTAEKALLLDFDKGSYRSKNRRDVVQVESWADVTSITAEDLKQYSTLVVDTAGRALDCLSADIIAANPKMGRGGALTLQGYGELKSKFIAWTKLVRSFGLDVVLLCHSDEQRNGDELIERLDMQGGSKNEVYKASDLMGRIYLAGGKRTLNFSPTDTAFGKNPAQLAPIDVPDFATTGDFLAGVIAHTKASLNAMSAEQVKAAAMLGEWKEKIDKAVTVVEFDDLVEPIRASDKSVRDNVKKMLVKAAKEKGLVLDRATGKFSTPAAPEAAKPAEAKAPAPTPERRPGEDDDDAAARAAAAPTAAEAAKLAPSKKGKAA